MKSWPLFLAALATPCAFAQSPNAVDPSREPNWKQIAVIEQQQLSAADAQRRQTELEASVKVQALQSEIDALKTKLAEKEKPEGKK